MPPHQGSVQMFLPSTQRCHVKCVHAIVSNDQHHPQKQISAGDATHLEMLQQIKLTVVTLQVLLNKPTKGNVTNNILILLAAGMNFSRCHILSTPGVNHTSWTQNSNLVVSNRKASFWLLSQTGKHDAKENGYAPDFFLRGAQTTSWPRHHTHTMVFLCVTVNYWTTSLHQAKTGTFCIPCKPPLTTKIQSYYA